MSVIGYARVSTLDQDTALQTDALSTFGCERIFEDYASGSKEDRPELAACLDYLREGDTVVIWKLDRLGRSLPHLLSIADQFRARGIQLVITTMGIDTRTPGGKLLFSVLGAVAEYERDLIRERTAAGLAAARARGRKGGRPKALTDAQEATVRRMHASRQHSIKEIAKTFRVSKSVIERAVSAKAQTARTQVA
jgi:DNA invertase Pin-like site-specific DNA recombinase